MRRNLWSVLALAVALAGLLIGASVVLAGNTVGQFEIEGNTPDDPAVAGIDWDTASTTAGVTVTPFVDDNGDTQFGGGSKWNDQATWTTAGCPNTGSVTGKSDIKTGAVAFRTIGTDQFAYVNWTRIQNNGSVNIDYEFNQSSTNVPNCPLPVRTTGDIVIAFDQTGNKTPNIRIGQWTGTAFNFSAVGNIGVNWDAAVNPDTLPGSADNGRLFGEAAINISAILGESIGCGDFASVHMDSRSSDAVNSNMQDRTTTTSLNFANCPSSTLTKDVRNVTTSGTFDGDFQTDASPGDLVEYQLTYTNDGPGTANAVTITDTIPPGTSYEGTCSDSCVNDSGTLTWNVGQVGPNGSATVTYQVRIPTTADPGTIPNVASVATTEEGSQDSNQADVTITGAPASSLVKAATNEDTGEGPAANISAEPGQTVTYSFTYTNEGTTTAHNVVITDEVPDGTTFDSGSGCTLGADQVTVTCSLGNVAPTDDPKTVSFTVKLDNTFPAGVTEIKNTASVDTDEEEPTDSNEVVVTIDAAPDLQLAKTSSTEGPVAPGDEITYTLTYSNDGNRDETGVVITEPIPEGTTFSSCDPACDETNLPDSVSWDIGDVAAGADPASVSLTVTVDEDAGAEVCNTATIDGDSTGDAVSSEEVCLDNVNVQSSLDKSAENLTTGDPAGDNISASPGDSVKYSFTYSNDGTTTAHNVTITDEVPDGTTFVEGDGCTLGADNVTVTCALGDVAPNDPKTVSFTVKLDDTFPAGVTEIKNTASVDTDEEEPTDSDEVIVTVTATPDLNLEKSADVGSATEGTQVTYTLTYSNDGTATATDVTVTEPIPGGTKFISCDPTCAQTGDPVSSVSWDVGDLDSGEGGTLTLVVEGINSVGCTITNTATIESADQDGGEPEDSNTVDINGVPAPNPAGAHANGEAQGIHISDSRLNVDINQGKVSSSQSGVGSDSQSDSVLNINVAGLAAIRALSTSSTSTVTPNPVAAATQTSTSELTDVNLVAGLVTADVVRGVATTTADGSGSSFSSTGTSFANLTVSGQSLVNVAPNTKIGLPRLLFGKDSYVALREEVGNTSGPSAGTLSGGTYAANLEVNMIRVHITDLLPLLPGKQATEIIVGHTKAHSDFPQTRLCAGRANQSVSGHAFVAAAQTDPDLLPALVGYTYIPTSGGDMSTSAASVSVPGAGAPGAGSILSAAAVDARSQGTLGLGSSTASSHAQIADLCLLRAVTGLCTVGATAVRSQASSTAVPGAAASTDSTPPPGTQVLGLQIAGVPGPILAPRNSVIPLPGLGYLALNQQFCDGAGTPPTCAGSAHSGLTVRQVVLVVTVPNPLGLKLGAQVVVAEAHSDATYGP